jgi:tetratricopeptide (TPR) repeat protein/thiol-disulfide isomerase/thioredoxin
MILHRSFCSWLLVAPLALGGCARGESVVSPAPAPAVAPSSSDLPVELDAVAFAGRWIEDDYPRALAEAKKSHKAVFVDAWATFCHTCQHMREVVLDDPRLRSIDKEVVWLSIEVDRPANEAFVQAHAAKALPTFFVLDEDGHERARWVGAMDGEGVQRFVHGGVSPDPALARVTDLYLNKKLDECVREGQIVVPGPPTYGHLGVVTTALACALDRAPASLACSAASSGPCADLRSLRQNLTEIVTTLRRDTPASQLQHADDLSSAYEVLLDSRRAVAPAEASRQADEWVRLLDGFAAEAPTAERRAAFDAHRVLAYQAAGTPERAIPMLSQSRREFPQDYNPPARLATIFLALKRLPEALAANAQALTLVYGPRTLRVYAQRADLFRQSDKPVDEMATLAEALRWAEGRWLPEGARRTLETLRARHDSLKQKPTP